MSERDPPALKSLVLKGRYLILLLLAPAFVFTSSAVLPAVESPQETIRDRLKAAEESLNEEEFERATSEVQEALGIALDQIGAIESNLGDYQLARRAYEEACQESILSIRPFLGLAIVYLRTGQLEKGIELLTRMLEINPTNPEAKHLLGKFYYMQGDFRSAARELRDAYSAAPNDTSIAYTLALAYLEEKDYDRAGEIFEQMVARLEDSAALRVLFGRAYRETENWSLAVEQFKKARELEPDYPRAHYYLGLTYLLWEGAAAFEDAERELKLALARDEEQYFPNLYLGVINATRHDDSDALHYLQEASRLAPENPDPYLYMGQILIRMEKIDDAIAALEKSVALTTDPARNNYQVSNAHFVLGQALLKVGRREEAVEHVRRSQELKRLQDRAAKEEFNRKTARGSSPAPDGMSANSFRDLSDSQVAVILDEPLPDPETRRRLTSTAEYYRAAAGTAYQMLARIDTRRKEFSRAAARLEKGGFWDDSVPDLYFNIAVARYKAGEYASAVAPLRQVLRQSPSRQEAVQLLASVAFNLVEERQTSFAIEALDVLVEIAPQVAGPYVLRGQAYAQQGNYDRALENFRAALERDSSLDEVHYYAGMALIRQGKLSDAVAEFDRELVRNPSHAMALYHKAFVLITQHNLDEATGLLQRVIELQPRYPEAYYQLGKIQLEKDQLLLATANLEVATHLDPYKSYLFYQLSRAYTRSGRRDDAEKALARYRELKKVEDEARHGQPPDAQSQR